MSNHDPLTSGLWARFLRDDTIVHEAWLRAHAEHQFVGNCRSCEGYLQPEMPDEVGHTTWYVARCVNCPHEIAAPNGRVMRRSSRRSEQPAGWWEHRKLEPNGR